MEKMTKKAATETRRRILAVRGERRTTLGFVFVYGGALIAFAVLVWGLFVAADRPSVRTVAPAAPMPERAAPINPPSGAVLSTVIAGVRDADVHDGFWFLLDRFSAKVHRVDAQGFHQGSFAGRGEGPGELGFPQAIAAHADTIVVATWRHLQLYRPDGTSIAQRRIEPPAGCPGALVRDVASSRSGLLMLFTCDHGADLESLVVLEADKSVYHTLAARFAGSADKRVWNPFRNMPVLAIHPKGFLFGHPSDDCLELFDLDGRVVESVCHRWLGRNPVHRANLDEWDEIQKAIGTVGLTPRLPEHYPPFDKVFVREDTVLVYRTQTSDQLRSLRQSSREGEPDAAFRIPSAPVVFFSGASVLAIWYDLAGTWIAVYGLAGT